jgi:heme/copper-type cytochrome/quinol oxidase subunit 2
MFLNLVVDRVSNFQLGFQIPASPVMEGIINFHHDLFFFLTAILFFVFYLFVRCLMLFNSDANPKPIVVVHAPILEII